MSLLSGELFIGDLLLEVGVQTSDRGDFWAQPVEILVFANPTSYNSINLRFSLLNWVSYSINSSKMAGNFPAVSTSTG